MGSINITQNNPLMLLKELAKSNNEKITNIFLARKCIVGGVHKVRRIRKILIGAWVSRTTSPHTFTGKTRLYTQHFAANQMSDENRV